MTAALATFFADPWFDAIAAIGLLCIAYCTVAEIRERARDRAEQPRYTTAPSPAEQRAKATLARWRHEDSPANQREAAPWFGGGAS